MSPPPDESRSPIDPVFQPSRSDAARAPAAAKLRKGDHNFIREGSAAVFEGPRRFAHLILAATAVFFATALVWAGLATLDEVTVGEGKVIPSSRVQVVQNLEGGIVSDILVQAGQMVEKDQPLMRIDDTRFAASLVKDRRRIRRCLQGLRG